MKDIITEVKKSFMKKKRIIILVIIMIFIFLGVLVLLSVGKRTDVYLKYYEISSDGKTMTLKIGVTNSSGYVRNMKRTSVGTNYYYTFYSTFGINSKLGSKDTFTIDIDENVDEVYFYTGDDGYKLVLQKDINNNWIKPSNCNYEFKEYLTLKDKKIFTVCLDEVYLKENSEKITLNDYLKDNNNDIEKFIAKLDYFTDLNDGGTKIFKNNDITLIKCNTLDGCKDIYIGPNNLDTTETFKQHACNKYFIEDVKFTRKYKIENITLIEEINLEDLPTTYYAEIKVSDELGNKTSFKKEFRKEIYVTLKQDKWYNFDFNNKYGELIKEDIKEIFEKCGILSIELTSN